jgi:hypothetical protein
VKAFDASQIQRIDQIGAAGELSEAAMRLRQPCGSGQAGARAFRALQAHLRSPRIRADLLDEGWRVSVNTTGSNESTTDADIAMMSPVDFEDRITQTAQAA